MNFYTTINIMGRIGEKVKKYGRIGAKIGVLFGAGYLGHKVQDMGESASREAFNEQQRQNQRALYEGSSQPGGGIIPKAPTPGVSQGYSGVVVPHHTPVPPTLPPQTTSSGYSGVVTPATHGQHGVPWARTTPGREEYLAQQQGSRPYFGGV
jgi:hypothetical protein